MQVGYRSRLVYPSARGREREWFFTGADAAVVDDSSDLILTWLK